MFDIIEAVLLEAYDLRSRVNTSRVGSTVSSRSTAMLATSRDRAGSTAAARTLGDGARKLSTVLSSLPVITLTPDAIRHAYCVDLLADRWKADRTNPLAAIQLAEALVAAQQAQAILRLARVADPASYLLGAGLRYSSQLGRNETLPTAHVLARAVHRSCVRAGGPTTVDQHLALARAYRITGKPGLATRYASAAGKKATDGLRDLRHPEGPRLPARLGSVFAAGSWRGAAREILDTTTTVFDRMDRAAHRLEASYTGDSQILDPTTRARMQAGAAWTTIAWALRDTGDRDAARAAANAAVTGGFTAGNEVLAALVATGDDNLQQRIGKRVNLLAKVSRGDRTFYRGRWRGSAWIAGATVIEQQRKARRLLDR